MDNRSPSQAPRRVAAGDSLADLLERVLDKGVVIAGDVSVALVGIELLTIKLRLLIASADKAREMGIDWWARDTFLSGGAVRSEDRIQELEDQNRVLLQRLATLEEQAAVAAPPVEGGTRDGEEAGG